MELVVEQNIRDIVAKYSVDQDYDRYRPEDHETWHLATRELEPVLVGNTAVDYQLAFKSTGMSTECIPRIENVKESLQKFGWDAIVVDGFIPPDVFMSLQANSILPISRPIRSQDQLGYTPIPDIVHEAAGHLPMLQSVPYRSFLRKLGEIGASTRLTSEDMAVYESQKHLAELLALDSVEQSILDEARLSVAKAVERANQRTISLARKVARFHWWTVEYGLIGPEHKIFGAGLLSATGEAEVYRDVPHYRLSVDCCNQSFEIDHVQPNYFVADSWDHLESELDKLEAMVVSANHEHLN